MKQSRLSLAVFTLFAAANASSPVDAAEVMWGDVFEIFEAAHISNSPGSQVHFAADFNNDNGFDSGDDRIINGIEFQQVDQDIPDRVFTDMGSGPNYNAGWVGPISDDFDLDALLNSHAWKGGNPTTALISIEGLQGGRLYQVQLITVADDRGCCSGRIYEPDDGQGNWLIDRDPRLEMQRGFHASLIGTFVADAAVQDIQLRSLDELSGNSDPGLSGLIVLELPADDTDGDGLFDTWETENGLNPQVQDSDGDGTLDGEEDPDADGLNNLGEQEAATDPNKTDTDGDGLSDKAESNTGTWVSTEDTGTSPVRQDTDRDGLNDELKPTPARSSAWPMPARTRTTRTAMVTGPTTDWRSPAAPTRPMPTVSPPTRSAAGCSRSNIYGRTGLSRSVTPSRPKTCSTTRTKTSWSRPSKASGSISTTT